MNDDVGWQGDGTSSSVASCVLPEISFARTGAEHESGRSQWSNNIKITMSGGDSISNDQIEIVHLAVVSQIIIYTYLYRKASILFMYTNYGHHRTNCFLS